MCDVWVSVLLIWMIGALISFGMLVRFNEKKRDINERFGRPGVDEIKPGLEMAVAFVAVLITWPVFVGCWLADD